MSENKAPLSPRAATIFGAGITGLTVAHELVERGFRVQVWEPQGDDRMPRRGCDVGGLARTQWSRVHWPEYVDSSNEPIPRVGRQPHDLWLNGAEDFVPGPQRKRKASENSVPEPERAPDDKSAETISWGTAPKPKETMKELLKRVAMEGERATVTVYYRALGPESEPEFQSAINKFLNLVDDARTEIQVHSTRATRRKESDSIDIQLDNKVHVAFQFIARRERDFRKSLVAGYSRFELYYAPSWGVETQPITQVPQSFYFLQDDETLHAIGAFGATDVRSVFNELQETLLAHPDIEQVYLEVYNRLWDQAEPGSQNRLFDTKLADKLREAFAQEIPDSDAVGKVYGNDTSDRLDFSIIVEGRIVDAAVVRLDAFPAGTPSTVEVSITYRVRERWFPGEHGYRFFPRFYHHLFDTMQRTPILDIVKKDPIGASQERSVGVNAERVRYVESGRTAMDNLVPRPSTIIAFTHAKKPRILGRYLASSFSELAERSSILLDDPDQGGFGFTPRDASRFFLRSFQYLTTCSKRRETYESISWLDYLGIDSYSPAAQEALSQFPKALVAMDGKESDARTIGSVGAQCGLDQLYEKGYQEEDAALNGPTNFAWLDHWRRYLEAQGVEFIHGELVSFEEKPYEGKKIVWPTVRCFEPRLADAQGKPPPLMPGYFVVALPVEEALRVAIDSPTVNHKDFESLKKFPLDEELRRFAGIQYYFCEDLFWLDGHAYFPDSPWGITSISQTRRWADRPDWEHGYRGILSVIIGRFDKPGTFVKKTPNMCTPAELAKEAWYQVRAALNRPDCELPQPIYWHLDDNLSYYPEREPDPAPAEDKKCKAATDAPRWRAVYEFQIETPGNWSKRPGDLGDTGYCTDHNVVLAGTYMKTHTRLTCMEAANESARHAVNAILKHSSHVVKSPLCDILPIEQREIKDLEYLKELDEKLFERNLPHFMEILGVDYLTSELLRGGRADPFDPRWLLDKLRTLSETGVFSAFSRNDRRRRAM